MELVFFFWEGKHGSRGGEGSKEEQGRKKGDRGGGWAAHCGTTAERRQRWWWFRGGGAARKRKGVFERNREKAREGCFLVEPGAAQQPIAGDCEAEVVIKGGAVAWGVRQ